jgi:hypothetical protein
MTDDSPLDVSGQGEDTEHAAAQEPLSRGAGCYGPTTIKSRIPSNVFSPMPETF